MTSPSWTKVDIDIHPAQDDAALRATCESVRNGDWTAARDLMAATRADLDLRARRSWVLSETVTGVSWARSGAIPINANGQVDTTATWVDRWAAEEPTNPDAMLVRARSMIGRGWAVRGSGWASSVSRAAFHEFHRLLLMAIPLCHEAARLFPEDPTPWGQLMMIASPLGVDRANVERCWAEVTARSPFHREAHAIRLMYLCKKWRGSHEEMFAFAREAAATAPPGSPLHALPLQANAEWARWELTREPMHAHQTVYETWLNDSRFQAELDGALNRWFAVADGKHGLWYTDLNYLAYALNRAQRYDDARPVFEAIGPYFETLPWAWGDGPADFNFRQARSDALVG
jgi:hypothetical protein